MVVLAWSASVDGSPSNQRSECLIWPAGRKTGGLFFSFCRSAPHRLGSWALQSGSMRLIRAARRVVGLAARGHLLYRRICCFGYTALTFSYFRCPDGPVCSKDESGERQNHGKAFQHVSRLGIFKGGKKNCSRDHECDQEHSDNTQPVLEPAP